MIKKIDANKYGVVRYAISSIEDIADLPREVSVGSEAILVNEDGEKKFRLGSDGWVEVVEVKEYDEDKLRDILEDAKVGYGGIEYETLEERLDKDFDNVYSVLDNRAYIEYEGCRITAKDSLNGLQKETVVKGRTLQNIVKSYKSSEFMVTNAEIVSEGVFKVSEGTDINHTSIRVRARNHLYKPNTTYTLFVDILENTTGKKLGISNIYSMINDVYARDFQNLTGVSCLRFTTTTDGLTTKGVEPTQGLYFGIWDANDTSGEFSKYIKFKYWILEGDYTETPLEELPFIEGIESVGDKSRNLFNGKLEIGMISTEGVYTPYSRTLRTQMIEIKPNTQYRSSFDIKYVQSNTDSGASHNRFIFFDENRNYISYIVNKNDFITPTNAKYLAWTMYSQFKTMDITQEAITKIKFQIEKGTQVTPYQEYYDGYKISGKSCGVNLAKEISEENYVANGKGEVIFENNKCIAMDKSGWASCYIIGKESIKVKPNTIYYGGLECEEGSEYLSQMKLIYKCFDINNNVITTARTVTLSNDAINFYASSYNDVYQAFLPLQNYYKYVKFSSEVHSVELIFRPAGSSGTITNTFKNILFVETDKQPTYEPYKESTYSYILDEPLRSLPNEVCDEIDLEKGIVTRRVGKVVLDGSEVWYTGQSSDGKTRYTSYIENSANNTTREILISDKFCYIDTSIPSMDNGAFIHVNHVYIYKYDASDSTALKQWLKDNPTTVYYELANPTTEYLIKDDKFVTLPNGVKDEAGRIVTRNVGKVVLNGSRKWTGSAIKNENHIKYFTYINDENGERLKVDNAPIISPTFPVIGCGQNSGDLDKYKQDIEGLYADTTISISVAKNRLETEDAEGLKKWLSQNPITVYYELTKPYMECSYEKYPVLPNGVKDEISCNSVLRKVGKITLNGSQVFETTTGVEGIVRWGYYVPQVKIGGSCICGMFDYIAPVQTWWKPFKDGITVNSENSDILIYMDKYKEAGQHVEEVRALLDGLEVYYELKTPYIEPINLNEVILDTIRLKSYEPVTHITSDNYLPPTIKTQVPSDFNAVVLGLKSNNEALTSQVMSLRQTNDELETTNREQDDVIDVTLLALDEVYGMIDEGEIETMSTGSPMVNVYVKMIKRGIKTLDEVPTKYRAEVEKLI